MLISVKNKSQYSILQHFRLIILFGFLLLTILSGCSGLRGKTTNKSVLAPFMSDQNHHYSGLLVVNIKQNDTLIKYNQDRYFIPASTAKLFTLYTSLKLMGSKLPALKYLLPGVYPNPNIVFIKKTRFCINN